MSYWERRNLNRAEFGGSTPHLTMSGTDRLTCIEAYAVLEAIARLKPEELDDPYLRRSVNAAERKIVASLRDTRQRRLEYLRKKEEGKAVGPNFGQAGGARERRE